MDIINNVYNLEVVTSFSEKSSKIRRLNELIKSKLASIFRGNRSASNTHAFSAQFDLVNSDWYKSNLAIYDDAMGLLSSAVRNLALGVSDSNGIMVYGLAGLGKTYNIINALDQVIRRNPNIKYHQIKGKITPIELYTFVCEHSSENDIVIFDDCDTAFTNNDSMNLIKAMTDTYDVRKVTYNSPAIARRGIPTEFIFNGKLIMITNQSILGNEHYNALRDRMLLFTMDVPWDAKFCKSIDIVINSPKYRRSSNYRLMAQYIVDYMYKNKAVFDIPEYSLRTILRLLNVYQLVGNNNFIKFIHGMHEFNWSKESTNFSITLADKYNLSDESSVYEIKNAIRTEKNEHKLAHKYNIDNDKLVYLGRKTYEHEPDKLARMKLSRPRLNKLGKMEVRSMGLNKPTNKLTLSELNQINEINDRSRGYYRLGS